MRTSLVKKALVTLSAVLVLVMSTGFGARAGAGPLSQVPGVPVNVAATPASSSLIASWYAPVSDGGSSVLSYNLRWAISSSGSWSELDGYTPAVGQITNVINGLSKGVAYDVEVQAVNAVGAGAWSDAVTATPYGLPGQASDVGVVLGSGQAALSWTAANGEGLSINGYNVGWSSDGGSTWNSALSAGSGTTYTVTGLVNGTQYLFRVQAINDVGPGSWTAPIAGIPAGVPDAPHIDSTTPGNGQITAFWSAGADNGSPIASYTFLAGTDTPPLSGPWAGALSCRTTGQTCTISGLTPGVSYNLVVKATSAVGDSPYSDVIPIVAEGVPAAPTGLLITPGHGWASLSWTAGADNGESILGYQVEYMKTGDSSWSAPLNASSTSLDVYNLLGSTEYSFRVKSSNVFGDSAWSDVASATILVGPPSVVSDLKVAPGDGKLSVSWTPGFNGGDSSVSYTAYAVDHPLVAGTRTSARRGYSINASGKCVTAGSACVISGLKNGKTYYVFVVSSNSQGGSGVSASVPGTPKASVVPGPTPTTTPSTPSTTSVPGVASAKPLAYTGSNLSGLAEGGLVLFGLGGLLLAASRRRSRR